MRTVIAIAKNTFREAIRRRVLNIILVFAAVSIGTSQLFSWLSPAEETKFILDMCSGSIRFFSMLLAVVIGASMIPTEVERRTIFVILSKPVGRTQFLVGKYLGGALTLWANIGIMAVIYLGVLLFKARGYAVNLTMWEGIFLTGVEVSVLLSVAVAASSVASTAFNVVFSFFVYFAGQMGTMFHELSDPARGANAVVRFLLGALYAVLPHFENYDLRQPLLMDTPVPWTTIGWVTVQGLVYIVVMMVVGHLLFSRREF